MSDKENKDPKATSKYVRRERKQTAKGERFTEEMKKKKRSSQNQKISSCSTCESTIDDISSCQSCSICFNLMHMMCTVVLNGKDLYCSKCVGQLKWEEIEEFEASNCIKHLFIDVPKAAIMKWRSPGQIEQNRLAALARRKQRIKENQAKRVEETSLIPKKSTPSKAKISPEKELLRVTEILEDNINSQLKQLEEIQLSQTMANSPASNSEEKSSMESQGKEDRVSIDKQLSQERSDRNLTMCNEKLESNTNVIVTMVEQQDESKKESVETPLKEQLKKIDKKSRTKAMSEQEATVEQLQDESITESVEMPLIKEQPETIDIKSGTEAMPEQEAGNIEGAERGMKELIRVKNVHQTVESCINEILNNVSCITSNEETLSTEISEHVEVYDTSITRNLDDILLGDHDSDSSESFSDSEDETSTEFYSNEEDQSSEDENETQGVADKNNSSLSHLTESREYASNQTLMDTEMLLITNLTSTDSPSRSCIIDTAEKQPTFPAHEPSNTSNQPPSAAANEVAIQQNGAEPTCKLCKYKSHGKSSSACKFCKYKVPQFSPPGSHPPISVIDSDSTTMNTDLFTLSSTTSPANIPEPNENEFFTQSSDGTGFTCKLCQYKSTSKGGVKNHITRTHKIQKTLLHPPRNNCKKCNKEVKNVSEAGQCSICGGYEHYRCTQSGKQNKSLFLNGLPFKCVSCCIPGIIISPEVSIRKTVTEENNDLLPVEKESSASSVDIQNISLTTSTQEEKQDPALSRKLKEVTTVDTTGKTAAKATEPKNGDLRSDTSDKINEENNDAKCSQISSKQLRKDNAVLTKKVKELMQKEDQTNMRMTLLSVDNTKLNDRVNELEEVNAALVSEKNDFFKEKESLRKQLEALKIENSKTKEVALEVQKVLTGAMKEANFHSFNKDKEIEKLVKENERLKTENETYKELLSPEIAHQRALRSREIASKASNKDVNYTDSHLVASPDEQSTREHHVSIEDDPNDDSIISKTPMSQKENEGEWDTYDKRDDLYADWDSDVSEYRNDSARQSPLQGRERKTRYCHFYNRDGCTTLNCAFLHDVAPVCEEYLRRKCRRRLCQYRHEEEETFWNSSPGKPPEQQREKPQGPQNPWIQIGPRKSPNQTLSRQIQPQHQMQSPQSNRRLPHHRYRYTKNSEQMQQQQTDSVKNCQRIDSNLLSYQSYPPMRR